MSGGDQITATYIQRFVDEDVVVIQFTNNAWGPSRRVRDVIPEIVFGAEPPPLPAARVARTKAGLWSLTGTYRLPDGREFEVRMLDGRLAIPAAAPGIARLLLSDGAPPAREARERDESIATIVHALARGELGPLRDHLWKRVSVADEQEYWGTAWKEWTERWGAYRDVEVIRAEPGRDSSTVEDIHALIHFERGSRLVTFKKDRAGDFYIDTSTTDVLPAYFQFVPVTRRRFVTYDFHFAESAAVEFARERSGVIVELAKGSVRARRVR